MRLNFAQLPTEMTEEAVARLARAARIAGARDRGSGRPKHAASSSRLPA